MVNDYNLSLYDGGWSEFLDSKAFEIYPHSDNAQATKIASNKTEVLAHAYRSLFYPTGQGAAQAPAKSPPVDTDNLRARRSSRRKQSTSQDGTHEEKRTRGKQRQHIAAQEQTQVSLMGISSPAQKGIVTVLVLDSQG